MLVFAQKQLKVASCLLEFNNNNKLGKPKAQEQIKELLNDPEKLKVLAEQAKAEADAKKAADEAGQPTEGDDA